LDLAELSIEGGQGGAAAEAGQAGAAYCLELRKHAFEEAGFFFRPSDVPRPFSQLLQEFQSLGLKLLAHLVLRGAAELQVAGLFAVSGPSGTLHYQIGGDGVSAATILSMVSTNMRWPMR